MAAQRALEPADHTDPGSVSPVPPLPIIRSVEWGDWPCLLIDDKHLSVGWQNRPAKKGGPCYLVGKMTAFGTVAKVVARFPFTEAGWAQAWEALARRDTALVTAIRTKLNERVRAEHVRTELARLDASALATMPGVIYLGGYDGGLGIHDAGTAPESPLTEGHPYDVRFLNDRMLITPIRGAETLVEVSYPEIDTLEVGGPGIISKMSRRAQAGMALALGRLGVAIAYADTEVQTILRIQASGGELHFLCTTVTPDALRVQLSAPLSAIRQAQAAKTAPAVEGARETASPVDELSRLAALLEAGLLTREEFDRLNAQLLAGS